MKIKPNAEVTALLALEWLARHEDQMQAFFSQTGVDLALLRAKITETEYLAAIFDFILEDENRAVEFAHSAQIAPEALLQIRALLPGGDAPHWT